MEITRANVLISGRVQGVFFRTYTQEQAESLGLTGWVKNLADGRVEAVFEGEKDKVEKVVKWCHCGPSDAQVTKVEVKQEEPSGEFSGFEVRYF